MTGGGLDSYTLPSGGDALRVWFDDGIGNTGDVAWAPGGGGAGGLPGANGAAAGDSAGSPQPEGGLSSLGVTGGTGG